MSSRGSTFTPPTIGVSAASNHQNDQSRAEEIAQRLGLCLQKENTHQAESFDFLLHVSVDCVELLEVQRPRSRPLIIDFIQGSTAYRRRSANLGRQPLASAIGMKNKIGILIDATAGLARDAFHLACMEFRIITIERSAILALLIEDALRRGLADGDTQLRTILKRITLVQADATDYLAHLTPQDHPDVIYLDPMYTPRKSSALSKRDVRLCRKLVGDDLDAKQLFSMARQTARKRVVVKRHPDAPPLAPHPDLQFRGKSVRYDVYLMR